MTDLAAQILAALDRAEETAWEASEGPWDRKGADIWGPAHKVAQTAYYPAPTPLARADAAHIATWDPAHVLRLTAALREVVAEVESWRHDVCDDGWYTCAAATEEREGEECINDARRGGPCDCGRDRRANRILTALASVWDVPGVAE